MIQKPLNRNKKGTVLFTVIVVMMVMTVILMATFVVIVAAQKQAINNFTDNQAYVTAKSVLDSFIACVKDKDDANYDSIREMMIGIENTGGTQMNGGLYYQNPDSTDNVLGVGNSYKYVEVDLPADGLGEIMNDGIKVQRLDRTKFKISVTVKDGSVRDSSGGLADTGNSVKTVSQIIKLSANPNNGLFDAGMMSQDGNTTLNSDVYQCGGYVNLTDATNLPGGAVVFNGGSHYYGKVYTKAPMKDDSGTAVHFNLSTRNQWMDTEYVYYWDYIESSTGIALSGAQVRNIVPSGETGQMPEHIKNPYIYASGGSSSYVRIGSGSYTASTVGSVDGRVDIYSEGTVTVYTNSTVYGDIYAKGNVNISGTVYGNIYAGGSVSGGPANAGGSSYSIQPLAENASFPDPYTPNVYPTVQEVLDEPYKKNSVAFGTTKIRDACMVDASGNSTTTKVINLGSLPSDPVTGEKIIDPKISTGLDVAGNPVYPMEKSVTKAGSTVAYAAQLSGGTFNGNYVIKLGKEDLFFYVPSSCFNTWYQPATIRIEPQKDALGHYYSDINEYGNVYFYTPTGNFTLGSKLWLYTDWSGVISSGNRQFGSKNFGTYSEQSYPSRLFWLIDGDGTTQVTFDSGSSKQIHAYVYARDVKMNYSGLKGTNDGMGGNVYYDDQNLTGKVNNAAVIGSWIGKDTGLGEAGNAVIFVPPADNIFGNSSKSLLSKYKWNCLNYQAAG